MKYNSEITKKIALKFLQRIEFIENSLEDNESVYVNRNIQKLLNDFGFESNCFFTKKMPHSKDFNQEIIEANAVFFEYDNDSINSSFVEHIVDYAEKASYMYKSFNTIEEFLDDMFISNKELKEIMPVIETLYSKESCYKYFYNNSGFGVDKEWFHQNLDDNKFPDVLFSTSSCASLSDYKILQFKDNALKIFTPEFLTSPTNIYPINESAIAYQKKGFISFTHIEEFDNAEQIRLSEIKVVNGEIMTTEKTIPYGTEFKVFGTAYEAQTGVVKLIEIMNYGNELNVSLSPSNTKLKPSKKYGVKFEI